MSNTNITEIHKSLIDKCKQNETKAQFEIYKLYNKAMYNTSLRILNNANEAEEAMQDAFLKAFQSIDSFRFESNFGVWLRRITVNICLDKLRKHKIIFDQIDEHTNEIEEDNDTAELIEESEIMIKKIKTALSLLPDRERTVLSLYLFENYSHKDIAKATNIPLATSRTQYFRAKKKLLEQINKQ